MFVEKKLNKSGSTSVRVMQKVHGKRKCVKVIGHSNDTGEIELLVKRGDRWIEDHRTGVPLFEFDDEAAAYDRVLAGLRQSQLRLVGPELIYGTLFDRIGYDKVKTANNALFRALVVTRLYHPGSKLRTAEYMERFMHRSYSSDAVYRFLDELCVRDKTAEQVREASDESIGVKWQVEQVAFGHTKAVMGGQVTVAFYDTSTLYFESQEDDIRVPGYSKDGKNENPQVVLGLLVGTGGNPIGYELHKGNQYEGATLLPIVKKLERRFNLSHPMIVADAGLLGEKNIKQLEEEGYEYIIGARIRSMSKPDKEAVLGFGLKDGGLKSLTLKGRRHVISMSESRAKKDARDREKGVKRLEKRFASGKITKASVNNRGYNRLLSLQGETAVIIDQDKIAEDARLDGLKGYVTNSKIKDEEVAENYRNLHFIERAFRMNKTDLAIRPIYHRLFNRIEAHVCICFTAYAILLELERILRNTTDKKNKKPGITIYRAKFLAESLYEIEYVNPYNGQKMSVMLRTDYDEEVEQLLNAIGLKH
ncbi:MULTISPECIES: IS1634 family transposase [Bacteroidales]